ncbi:LysR substrate-binding domain-containing protein [Caballeronia sp. AZ7_KS35]|uniref:LysR substrate-binding domain-containing protein n=1 Tax=Caballeronia sp. AZ7_KS35 TaxID=2921762 RepID=UPI0020277571|nr:LysR substrate-binding domain-containing protein [Caballeronia sp. AZ7_KS35]
MADAESGARAELSPLPGKASGVLHVTAPSGFGQSVVLPMLPALLEANPELRIDLDLSDRQVDIVGQGLDLALRIAPLEDSELVAKKIGPNPRLICAAPVRPSANFAAGRWASIARNVRSYAGYPSSQSPD